LSTTIANRYQIVETLSEGGFGETWLAEDTHLPSRRRCVIKRLKPLNEEPQTYEIVANRFQREATILEDLGEWHNQIPRLYAYFESKGQFYLVQEWVQGQTLTQQVEKQGPHSESAVRALLVALLPVLDYIHSKQLVHRDLKPDNIILRTRDGLPTLIDFGAVKETMGAELTVSGSSTRSVMMGTPGYMPAEQAAGRPVYASDLYALGLTAIYALTGQPPEALAVDPSTGAIQWQEQVPQVSPTLASVLNTATQLNTQQRYGSAQAMLTALNSENTATATSTEISAAPQTEVSATPEAASGQAKTVVSPAPVSPMAGQGNVSATAGAGLKEWQKAVLTGIVMGVFVVGALLLTNSETSPFLQASSDSNESDNKQQSGTVDETTGSSQSKQPPTTQQPPSSTAESPLPDLSRQQAKNLIERWLQAKQRIFAPPYNRQLLAELTTGERYQDDSGSIGWLQRNNAYYKYGVRKVDSIKRLAQDGKTATVKFDYTEDRTLYIDGEVVPKETDFKTRTVIYNLQFENGQWKIASAKMEG